MTEQRPLVFLDIDGVLNGANAWNHGAQSNTIHGPCIEAFNHLLRQARPQIVLSSAWRYMLLCGAMRAHGFEYLLRTHGAVGIANSIIGTTCADEDCAHCGARGRRDFGMFRRFRGRSRPKKFRYNEEGEHICKECNRPSNRGHQIGYWLGQNAPSASVPYVVLDNNDFGIRAAKHPFVHTDDRFGLTVKDAERALRLLRQQRRRCG